MVGVKAADPRRSGGHLGGLGELGAADRLRGGYRDAVPLLAAALGARLGSVVMLDRSTPRRLANQLQKTELIELAHVVGDGPEGRVEHLTQLDPAGGLLLQDP